MTRDAQTQNQLWLYDLSLIPTQYGRLVYLAGLLDPDTGRYSHYGCTTAGARAEASRILTKSHGAAFCEWAALSLQAKMMDVEGYIDSIEQVDRAELLDAWLRLTPYKNLVPASIQGPERQKHISDFEAILGLLTNVYGVASLNPDA